MQDHFSFLLHFLEQIHELLKGKKKISQLNFVQRPPLSTKFFESGRS